MTILVLGIAIGIPLGILASRVVWQMFADGIGVVPEIIVLVIELAVICGAADAIAASFRSSRAGSPRPTRPAALLREE